MISDYPLTIAVLCFIAAGYIIRALLRRPRRSREARDLWRFYMRGKRR